MVFNQVEMFRAMKNNNTNLVKLAKKSGVSRCTVSNVYRGTPCKESTAEKIAAALGVPVSVLASDQKF